jgi:hypothetical protein
MRLSTHAGFSWHPGAAHGLQACTSPTRCIRPHRRQWPSCNRVSGAASWCTPTHNKSSFAPRRSGGRDESASHMTVELCAMCYVCVPGIRAGGRTEMLLQSLNPRRCEAGLYARSPTHRSLPYIHPANSRGSHSTPFEGWVGHTSLGVGMRKRIVHFESRNCRMRLSGSALGGSALGRMPSRSKPSCSQQHHQSFPHSTRETGR